MERTARLDYCRVLRDDRRPTGHHNHYCRHVVGSVGQPIHGTVNDLPKSVTGKILNRQLREKFIK